MRNETSPLHRNCHWRTAGVLWLTLSIAAATAWAGREVIEDGVTHVKNPAVAPQGTEPLELEEIWRAGGENDEETVFGVIVQAITDGDGNIYLLDMQLSQVLVFSPAGEWIKTLSREGDGPGEVRRAGDLLFLPDGSLGLLQTFPGKIVKIDREGLPAGEIVIGGDDPTRGGFGAVIEAEYRGENLVFGGATMMRTEGGRGRVSYLASFTADGVEKVRYWERESIRDFSNPELIEEDQYSVWPRRWAVGSAGEVYAASHREDYVIEVFSADGTLERVIEREFTNRKRTAAERTAAEADLTGQMRHFRGNLKTVIADTEPAIAAINVDSDGKIWVLHSSSHIDQPTGVMSTYDVYDRQGHLVKQVTVMCDGDGADDALLFAGADRFVHVKGLVSGIRTMRGGAGAAEDEDGDEEAGPMEVAYYARAN